MNTKLVVLLGSVGAVHLVAGGLFLAGGCTQEDPPMPPGIYVPKPHPEPRSTTPATPETSYQPTTEPAGEPVVYNPEPQKPAETGKKAKTEPAGDSGHGDRVHIVVKGDSLWMLARKNGLTVDELAHYNNLPANTRIKVGQKIYIPANGKKALKSKPVRKAGSQKGAKTGTHKGKKAAAGKKAAPAQRGKNLPADGIYTIKAGDNFSVIAKRHGLKVSDLIAANPGVDSSRLKIGQKIRLTASAAAVPKQEKNAAKKAADDKSASDAKATPSAPAAPAAEATSSPAAAKSAENEGDDLLKKVDDIKTENKAEPSASNDAVKAVASDRNDPLAVVPDKDRTITRDNGQTDVLVGADTTVELLSKKYEVNSEDVKKLNPGIPADGKIKTGTTVRLPD